MFNKNLPGISRVLTKNDKRGEDKRIERKERRGRQVNIGFYA